MKNSMAIPQKLKIELPYDPVILLLGIYPEKMKTLIRKDLRTSMFTEVLQQSRHGSNLIAQQYVNA